MSVDLDQSAHVLCLPDPPSTDGKLMGVNTNYFDHLRDAIPFVVENTDPNIRKNAWITIDGDTLRGDAILELYKTSESRSPGECGRGLTNG